MLTPQEVQERTFDKAVFGGYDMGEVDDFLDLLTEDYSALYKENSLLKSKMKVLVQAVEKYRAKEDEINNALKTAQENADNVISRANARASGILGGAREANDAGAALRQAAETYIAKAKKLVTEQAEAIERLESGLRPNAASSPSRLAAVRITDEPEEPTIALNRTVRLDDAAEDIDRSVRQAVESDERAAGARAKPKFEFVNLDLDKDKAL